MATGRDGECFERTTDCLICGNSLMNSNIMKCSVNSEHIFHSSCLNITDVNFKKLSKRYISTWVCNECKVEKKRNLRNNSEDCTSQLHNSDDYETDGELNENPERKDDCLLRLLKSAFTSAVEESALHMIEAIKETNIILQQLNCTINKNSDRIVDLYNEVTNLNLKILNLEQHLNKLDNKSNLNLLSNAFKERSIELTQDLKTYENYSTLRYSSDKT